MIIFLVLYKDHDLSSDFRMTIDLPMLRFLIRLDSQGSAAPPHDLDLLQSIGAQPLA